MEMTVLDLADRLRQVPDKAKLFFYSSGHDVNIVAEWSEGTQPVRRPVVTLPGVFALGGACR